MWNGGKAFLTCYSTKPFPLYVNQSLSRGFLGPVCLELFLFERFGCVT